MVKQRGGREILDVGSGPGQNARLFQDAGFEVTLLDGSKSMLELAADALNRNYDDRRNIEGDNRNLPQILPSKKYDGIWCSATLIHLPEPLAKQAISVLKDHLSENGVLMVNCAIDIPRLVAHDKRFYAYWGNREDFARLLNTAGLEIATVISQFVKRNIYNEPGLAIWWDNFFCTLNKEKPDVARTAEMTTTAYDLIVRRFIAQHVSHVDKNLINTYVDKIYRLVNERQLGKRILDAGCGPGHYTNAFATREFDATGVDLSTKMIESAHKSYGDNCSFKIADFYDLPFDDGSFSAVFCMAAFQHVPIEGDVALKTLRGFYRVLEENGIVMLNVVLYREMGFEPDGRFTQGYQDKEEVIDQLNKAGFQIIVEPHEWKLKPGENSFKREIELNFCDFIACKTSDIS